MNDAADWKVPKWPFLVGDGLLMAFGFLLVLHLPAPIRYWEIAAGCICVVVGAILGVIPFILDYHAAGKALEVNALGAVADRIGNLEQLSGQISSATSQWAAMEESVRGQADKTTVAAKAIADRMTNEVIEFSDFMKKMNDSEKATLKLEVEKLRRGEADWLQVVVTVLDHVYALHLAATRSSDPKFSGPITNFQNACRDAARRIGLAPFVAAPGEPFNAERHQVLNATEPPPAGSVVAETVGCGYTYQSRLLRPALVRLQDPSAPPAPKVQAERKPPVERAAPAPAARQAAAPAPVRRPPEKPASPVSAAPAPEKSQENFSLESPN